MGVCCTFVIGDSQLPMAIAFHTFALSCSSKHIFIGRVVRHLTSLLRLSVSPNLQDVLIPRDNQHSVANSSIGSIATVISLAHFRIVGIHVSQSFPLPTLERGSHLS